MMVNRVTFRKIPEKKAKAAVKAMKLRLQQKLHEQCGGNNLTASHKTEVHPIVAKRSEEEFLQQNQIENTCSEVHQDILRQNVQSTFKSMIDNC